MRRIVIRILMVSVIIVLLFGNLASQGVQAGISASYDTLIISAKPASNFSGQNYTAGNISIRWFTDNGVTLSAPINSIGSWVQDPAATNVVLGAFTYTTFNFVAGVPIPLNWTAGNEYVLFKVTISQTGTGTGTFELVESGFATSVEWYFELAGGDSTNYTENFYASSVDALLPIELTSFTATAKERVIELKWATATEINSNKFEIERNDGKEWKKVGEKEARGNSNAPKEYSYTDKIKIANNGKLSYRLKMIDNDGKFKYSAEAEVKVVPTVYALEQNYPNPFNPTTKIQYALPEDARVSLKVYDIVGREVATIVNEEQKAGYYEQNFGGYNFASGVYIYRIITEAKGKISFSKVKKMVLIK